MFRAAGIAAAVAFYAMTSFATPAMGQALAQPASAVAQPQDQVVTEQLVANDGPAEPAKPAEPGFSNLFGRAVAAIANVAQKIVGPAPAQSHLENLVTTYVPPAALDAQQDCLASAVYFEARGETLEGQLAVAQVVLNRAASGRFPADVCAVVTQKSQFSFVRRGRIPGANRNCDAWHRALAISQIARERLVSSIPSSVLWYHASYVSPGWGTRLTKTAQIGLHIFYS